MWYILYAGDKRLPDSLISIIYMNSELKEEPKIELILETAGEDFE